MRTLRHEFNYDSRSVSYRLYHLTDIHLGHSACDEQLLQEDIQRIADDENAYWGGGGDYIDAISRKGDKRFMESSLAAWLHGQNDVCGEQVRRFVELVKPIAHKCLYLLTGNHEDALLQYNDRDVYKDICYGVAAAAGKSAEALALGWEGFVGLTFKRGKHSGGSGQYHDKYDLMLYSHHGSGGGRKLGGHALRMEEILLTYTCDLALLGHRHIQQIDKKFVVTPGKERAELKARVGVWCGSYLGSYIEADAGGFPRGNYPQYKQLPPNATGGVSIEIEPDKQRFNVMMR